MNPKMTDDALVIAEWGAGHERWGELRGVVEGMGQTAWVAFSAPWHRSSHVLVATRADGSIAGFLRFVVQEIGAEEDHAIVTLDGRPLTEAKVLAFGVLPEMRRQGIGRRLQMAAIDRARELGCYQVRSHSDGGNAANHRLKLSMGFGVHPIIRGDDTAGVYFLLPLRAASR